MSTLSDLQLLEEHEERKRRLVNDVYTHSSEPIRLGKKTSNLFRHRGETQSWKLDVTDFNHVLKVNTSEGWIEAEGMTTFETLVDAALEYGYMPAVVPQLKSITIGGAVTGVGIESSSFKYGLVHESVLAMDILLANGTIVEATPVNDYKDLYFGFPNSYGTLGYALKLRVKMVPVKKYVEIKHTRYSETNSYFESLDNVLDGAVDFVDGTIFSKSEMYITIGRFVDDAPEVSDYTFKNIYYRAIQRKEIDYLTIRDYIWRWDTDWFWCSKNVFAQNRIIRWLYGKKRLNSISYRKIMAWNNKWRVAQKIHKILGIRSESIIQDVDIPIDHAAQFLEFFLDKINLTPVWMCPIRAYNQSVHFDLYPVDAAKTYINFGFWDVKYFKETLPKGYYNRMIEDKVYEFSGIKSLYSDSFFTEEEFRDRYGGDVYKKLKETYDQNKRFRTVYEKCVLKK